MKCLHILVVACFAVFSISCAGKEAKENGTIIRPNSKISSFKHVDGLRLSEFGDSIGYISLKLDSNELIGKITKILPLQDHIVVFDKNLSKGIYIFDKQGNQLAKIFRDLDSPTAPYSIEDVSVDAEKGVLYVYSANQNQVYSFDKNGKYLQKMQLAKGYFSFVQKIDDGFLCYREIDRVEKEEPFHNYRLCLLDSTGLFVKGWFNTIRNPNFTMPNPSVYFRVNAASHEVYFQSPYIDTILQLDAKEHLLKNFAVYDYNSNNYSRRGIYTAHTPDQYLTARSSSCANDEIPLITDRFILGEYTVKGGRILNYYYDLKTDHTVSGNGFKNDFDNIYVTAGPNYCITSNELITQVDNQRMLDDLEIMRETKEIDSLKIVGKKKELLNQISQNPETVVLALIKLKHE
ncbi:6-bladed beta-propeller [Chitinophaga pinensis]|uniref:6-bladed beta-propeller n=1 Tax=Chitinophaga pinensis (strain ATCC 43595 / DSM 2588 / LMG 13176 / NBRC 15968 / NCIMB 11800 / UQM 2034) TaxID=485918 RepID=A0A979GB04_CHIPD|nr:6-bladed beta-propeller [Chitinophaga pinensis]ACU64049.1 hypothetical protein Cpin_6645 [Chitinophaga pinensis DSM 2588]